MVKLARKKNARIGVHASPSTDGIRRVMSALSSKREAQWKGDVRRPSMGYPGGVNRPNYPVK